MEWGVLGNVRVIVVVFCQESGDDGGMCLMVGLLLILVF